MPDGAMVPSPAVLVIGLTGGIGSGKSTVSRARWPDGAPRSSTPTPSCARCRSRARPVFAAMVERFGPGIVAADGQLDRQAVADIVFADPEALADLNAIVHPAVGAEIARGSKQAADRAAS